MKQLLCSFSFLLFALMCNAQSISGFVYDSDGQAVQYATVSMKFEEKGTSCTNKGAYFLQFERGGPITLVTTAVGFKNKTIEVILGKRGM